MQYQKTDSIKTLEIGLTLVLFVIALLGIYFSGIKLW